MHKKKTNTEEIITSELLEKLRIEVMLREDEVAKKADESAGKAGMLNDPELATMAEDVENFSMHLHMLEKQFNEKKGE